MFGTGDLPSGQSTTFISNGSGLQALLLAGAVAGGISDFTAGIIDANQATGWAQFPDGSQHAFLSTGNALTDLGTLGGSRSSAYGINRAGTVIGLSTPKGTSTTHAFVYRSGKMYDLNQEIAPSGWVLLAASALNDAGQIVGLGMIRGQVHGFLLNPL